MSSLHERQSTCHCLSWEIFLFSSFSIDVWSVVANSKGWSLGLFLPGWHIALRGVTWMHSEPRLGPYLLAFEVINLSICSIALSEEAPCMLEYRPYWGLVSVGYHLSLKFRLFIFVSLLNIPLTICFPMNVTVYIQHLSFYIFYGSNILMLCIVCPDMQIIHASSSGVNSAMGISFCLW